MRYSDPKINGNKNKGNNKNKGLSSNSNSSTTSSSSLILPLTPRRGMEEVWEDINLPTLHTEIPTTPPLTSLHHHHLLPRPNNHPSSASSASSAQGIILQDFLAGPLLDQAPPPPPNPYHHHQPPPPSIDLNRESCCQLDPSSLARGIISPIISPQFGFCPNRKRVIEQQMSDGNCVINRSDDDRRHKRMIKNRESAARSRARKQAYTNELELEVAHLVQENSKLRRQYEELRSAMAAQIPAKKTLQRASSAPI